uniref:C2H2-type domain-containing protein n=1 Tax=Steinernema glaseri TaxID=37863 RepID=A0A1I8AIW1_9BILA
MEGFVIIFKGDHVRFSTRSHSFAQPNSSGKFECDVRLCGKEFITRAELLKHTSEKHTAAVYFEKGLLKEDVHNIDDLNCSIEANRFTREECFAQIFQYLDKGSAAMKDLNSFRDMKNRLRSQVQCRGDRRFFCYLLVDSQLLPENPSFVEFLLACFYAGKGRGDRYYDHMRNCCLLKKDSVPTLKE